LQMIKGIEIGHIFKLGYKYTDAFDIAVSGPDGKPVKPIMGCYGIGVERAMAACVEVHHDGKGIVWPAPSRRSMRSSSSRSRTTPRSPRRGSARTRRSGPPGWTLSSTAARTG